MFTSSQSLPVRERGLKLHLAALMMSGTGVAPRAGAWIEMAVMHPGCKLLWSLPVRKRGLKPSCISLPAVWMPVAPVRERGLKRVHHGNGCRIVGRSPCRSVD